MNTVLLWISAPFFDKKNYLINAPPREGAFIPKYGNPFVITDDYITETALKFTLIDEDDIDNNAEDDISVVD